MSALCPAAVLPGCMVLRLLQGEPDIRHRHHQAGRLRAQQVAAGEQARRLRPGLQVQADGGDWQLQIHGPGGLQARALQLQGASPQPMLLQCSYPGSIICRLQSAWRQLCASSPCHAYSDAEPHSKSHVVSNLHCYWKALARSGKALAWRCLLSATSPAQVDVYSFSMIAYQLFELTPPFSGMDPVDAARKAALAEERPPLMRLATNMPTMKVSRPQQRFPHCICSPSPGQAYPVTSYQSRSPAPPAP